jgi:hypothetical protein
MAVESVPGSITEATSGGWSLNLRATGRSVLRFISGPYIPVFVLLVVMVIPAILHPSGAA